MTAKRTSILTLARKKREGRRIVMITAYDFPFARIADRAGADVLLVGDSLANVVLGFDSTLPVTLDQMLYHTQAVVRAKPRALVVADLPFLSYQVCREEAVRSAGRCLKEGGADAVKLEGGREMADVVRSVVDAGIPVMGHLGLTPQSVSKLGGYRVQGRTAEEAGRILEDALLLEARGAFALVLECVPDPVAAEVAKRLAIPVIGIGAGPRCDGQVLVLHDLLGLTEGEVPSFVRRYGELGAAAEKAIAAWGADVASGAFPTAGEGFPMAEGEEDVFRKTRRP